MKIQKQFVFTVTSVIGLFLALIIITAASHNHFRNDAAKWASGSFDGSNIMDAAALKSTETAVLLINLDAEVIFQSNNLPTISVEPERIVEKSTFKKIHDHKGIKVIVSQDQALSGRIWMLLSQMGIRDLYILKESI
jgi:hypothetical protein